MLLRWCAPPAGRYTGPTMKAKDFLNSKWVEMAKAKGAELKVRKEFEHWVKGTKDNELVKRARQLWDYFNSGKVSGMEKVIVIAALLYLISPIDLVPDAIPVLGWLDDLGVAGIALNYVLGKMDAKGEGKKGKGGKAKAKGKDKVGPILKAVKNAFNSK